MPERNLPHIFLSDLAESSDYKSPKGGGKELKLPKRNHSRHSARILKQFNKVWETATIASKQRLAVSLQTKDGFYVEFRGKTGYELVTRSLEYLRSDMRLLNVRERMVNGEKTIFATVYIPFGKVNLLLKKINDYAADEKKNAPLIKSIESIKLAIIDSFWTDDHSLIPGRKKVWCEVWLRTKNEESEKAEQEFKALCMELNIEFQGGILRFPERSVLLVKTDRVDIKELIESSPYIAEFRLAKETADFWIQLANEKQALRVQDLIDRTVINESNVSVCVIDTGANNGHPLLAQSLTDDNCLTVDPNWGTNDDEGHGTSMCGIALYGDLQKELSSTHSVEVNHKLESVKLLNMDGGNKDERLWGDLTSQAVNQAEIQNPDMLRINCLAITSDDNRDHGRPSSWSSALDLISSGCEENDQKRLILVCAGNVNSNEWKNYPESNLDISIFDPAQSWNALTVGAVTCKTTVTNSEFLGYALIAGNGELSPFSTTSFKCDGKWPFKPDVVLEGGNAGKDDSGFTTEIDDLSVLTTHHNFTSRIFTTINGTSAATALAAKYAADIQARYPDAWPETVRALIVHSANWPEELKRQFGIDYRSKKSDYANLLKICGFGVPDLDHALNSVVNSVTLIAQETIQPFVKNPEGRCVTKDMHIYELPWPKEVLKDLGEMDIRLRVTLSYFIEPGPGEIGWKNRYRYPSHNLRFDLNNVNETKDQFLRRLNLAAQNDGEEEEDSTGSGSGRWLIGKNARHHGSIHSDIWEGSAADIASCNMIGVYPAIGWWRERAYLGRVDKIARYSLIVSLHTDETEVDIYTPILVLATTPIQIGN